MTRPPLIVVCGAPGSGKSTLARELAGRLRLAVVTKDDIKEARVVLCRCDPVMRRSRYVERDRHPVHLDAEILEREWADGDEINAIDIGVPRLVVDTTRPDGVDIDAIAAWMSTETGPRTSVHRPVD